MNEDRIVPSFLVYGVLSRLPGADTAISSQVQSMKSMTMARQEMETIVTKRRMSSALLRKSLSRLHMKSKKDKHRTSSYSSYS